jgi:hypothetical protein
MRRFRCRPRAIEGRLDILVEVWGGAEYEDVVVVVGESNGTEILRSVVVYSRVEDQQDAEAG